MWESWFLGINANLCLLIKDSQKVYVKLILCQNVWVTLRLIILLGLMGAVVFSATVHICLLASLTEPKLMSLIYSFKLAGLTMYDESEAKQFRFVT